VTRCLIGSVLGFFFGATSLLAQPAPAELHWLVIALPLVHELPGSGARPGFLDRLLNEVIIPGLPGYKHSIEVLPFERRNRMLAEDELACVPGLLRTPDREGRWRYAAAPVVTMLASGIYALKDGAAKFKAYEDANGAIELGRLLEDRQLTLGAALGRSNGPVVDALLAKAGASRVSIAAGPQPVLTLGRMLIARRFDGMLGQPYEIAAVAKTLNMPEDRFRFWPISEQPPLQSIYIACHRGQQGETRLADIERLFTRNPRARDAAQGFYESSLSTKDLAKLHKLMGRR